MKAEAPERIYVCDNVFPNHVDWEGSPINTKRIDDHDIEYIKMDAFIEKLDLWLYERGREYHGEFDDGFLIEFDKSEEAIKDFIKYVKGE